MMLMIINFGQFDAGFLLGILWRGLLAGAIVMAAAAVVLAVITVLLDEPLRWLRSHIRATANTLRRKHDDRRLRELEEENRRLKRLVAEQALDVLALKDVLSKNFGRPPSGGKS